MHEDLRQSMQTEKMLALTAMERKYKVEIEKAKVAERKTAKQELEELRMVFEKKEKETVEDLQSLEKLHQEQYSRMVYTRCSSSKHLYMYFNSMFCIIFLVGK